MADSLRTTPTATAYGVDDLVRLVRDGNMRIPEFQRRFRWNVDDARKFFDSIVRQYPVGSLLLWQRPADAARITVGALEIPAPAMTQALWVVDGQQRLTVLANALTAESADDPRFALSLDLTSGEIVAKTNPADPRLVPLPVLFDLQRLLAWFRDNPAESEQFEVATDVAKKIREFRIPASVVQTEDEAVLQVIFDRVNGYGKRLNRSEVFSALNTVPGSGSATKPIEQIVDYLADELRFGRVDEATILAAVLARRGPRVDRDPRGEFDETGRSDFPGESADEAYEGTQRALELAVDFLRADAAVPHFAFLPYRYLLTVLTRVFALYPDLDPRQRVLLRRWFWRAATAPLGSATQQVRTMSSLVRRDSADATVNRLVGAIPRDRIIDPDVRAFRTNFATGKAVACALWALGPHSLDAQSRPLTIDDLAEALNDDLTPNRALTAFVTRRAAGPDNNDSVGRYLLVPGVEFAPAEIADALQSISPAAQQSHALDASTIVLLRQGRLPDFVDRRTGLVADVVRDFLDNQREFEFEDTPRLDSLILDDLEAVSADHR